MVLIGDYILDTLQIYFPWDDYLYSYITSRGFGRPGAKAIPLIYTDNCESTVGEIQTRRNYVITPDKFGKSYNELGWEGTNHRSKPLIPAEKIKIRVSLEEGDKIIKFKVIPDEEQYHIEFCRTSSWGKMYSNWAVFYIPINNDGFFGLYEKLKSRLKYSDEPNINIEFVKEKQQNQRENFQFISLPITYYEFSLNEFEYAKEYLLRNGFTGSIPKLYYNIKENKCNDLMQVELKYGIIHTREEDGFENRAPQIAFKIAQNMIINLNENIRGKVKGIISEDKGENYFLSNSNLFMRASNKINNTLKLENEKKN